MKRRNFLRASLGMGATGLAASGWRVAGAGAAGADALQWRDRMLLGFGTMLSVRVAHPDSRQAEQALDAAVETIRHVEAQMSLFDPGSALSPRAPARAQRCQRSAPASPAADTSAHRGLGACNSPPPCSPGR